MQLHYIYDFLSTSVVNVDVSSKVTNPLALIEEQIQHFLTQKFGLLTTTAFVLRKGPGRGRRVRDLARATSKRKSEKFRADALKRQVVDRSCKHGSRMSLIEHHRWQSDGLKKPLDKRLNCLSKTAIYQATREERRAAQPKLDHFMLSFVYVHTDVVASAR